MHLSIITRKENENNNYILFIFIYIINCVMWVKPQ